MAAQMLMKRGKRTVANYIKAECIRLSGQQQLGDLLDYLLDPTKPLDDFDRIDWCRWLIAGGTTFDEFAKTVRQYDNATTCGLVWTADFVAYRCRTCGISPCMSLCSDCFQAGNHTGHDFSMFRSQAGGACDCGDVGVMKPCGFCPRHGPEQARNLTGPPTDLAAVAEAMMPRLIFRLIQHMREHFKPDMVDTYIVAMQDAEQFLNFLHQLSDMGAAMRQIFTKAVTNPVIYKNITDCGPQTTLFHQKSQENYRDALTTLRCPSVPDEFKDIEGLASPLNHTTLLDELLFWVVKFEFPQKIVTLLLSILPEDNYKEAFTKAFVQHYSRISIALVDSLDRSRISNRVVHISVQLLSPENLAVKMVTDYNLLYIMLTSLRNMVDNVLTGSGMNDPEQNYHMVVDCGHAVLKEHCYWPIVSDLINVLSHKPIAYQFMSNDKLLNFWFELISCFQGMNLNSRELTQHVEYEPDTYYAAFSAELEICSSPMWSMLVHCKDQSPDHCRQAKAVITSVLSVLQDWFDSINTRPYSRPNSLQVSFHIPLHRYFAVFVSQAVRHQGLDLAAILPPADFVQMLMVHPLQIQVVFQEIFCGLWVRNGLQIRGQAMTYIQCHFCNSMIDADLYLLQVCATNLDPDFYIKTVLERFHVLELLSFGPKHSVHKIDFLDSDHEMPMLEGALTFLALLLNIRTQLGLSEAELTKQEMVTLLCMSDRTHSLLMDMMPEKCGLTGQAKDFEQTLKEVADYKAPNFESGGNMQQGMYIPKGFIWEAEYDPLYVLLRAMYRRDFQASLDRYGEYTKLQGLYKGAGTPWPPFRLPGPVLGAYSGLRKLLHSRTMHGMLFTLLYQIVSPEKAMTDAVIYFTVFLLEMAVCIAPSTPRKGVPVQGMCKDKQFSQWFSSDDIFLNVQQVIPEVLVTVQYTQEQSMEGNEDDPTGYLLAPSAMGGMRKTPRSSSMVVPASASDSTEIVSTVHAMLDEATTALEASTSSLENNNARRQQRSQGVTTETPPKRKSVPMKVEENMLSLLIKLHAKLAGKKNSYVPESIRGKTSEASHTSRIGDGVFFVGKLLDNICRKSKDCASVVERIYRESAPQDKPAEGTRKTDDKEERRRRARERQQKLMADFANKQKKFMEQATVGMDFEEASSSEESQPIVKEMTYDCCICNQTTSSTHERPLGLVVLLQPSSLLGHRRQTQEPLVLPLTDSAYRQNRIITNCALEYDKRLKMLLTSFEETSAVMSVNIGWEGGVHAQTCGHYVHLDCHSSYVESLKTQRHQSLQANKGEYWCPLCRQLSNTAIPITPSEGAAVVVPTPTEGEALVRHIGSTMVSRPVTPGSSSLTKAMGVVMEDLTNATYPQFKTCARSHSAENVLLFVCSVLRNNLEVELLERNESPCLPPASALAKKKSSILPLLHVLSMHSKVLTTKPYTELWSHITGITVDQDSLTTSVKLYQQEVPLLLKDTIALIIQLTLTMPCTMDKVTFQCFVQALYNVTYVQACMMMACKFSEEERAAWGAKSKETKLTTLEGIMGHVIHQLSGSSLFEDDSQSDPHVPAICQSVWSPQSVEQNLQQHVLALMRMSSLLQHHLYQEELPVMVNKDDQEEFRLLASFLHLSPEMEAGPPPRDVAGSISRPSTSYSSSRATLSSDMVRWYCKKPQTLLQGWCQHFAQFVNKNSLVSRMLLMTNQVWNLPQLFSLPKQYDKIFQYYRKKECFACRSLPKDPALCLFCGRLLCFKEQCCRTESVFECCLHSIRCGGGVGIFLVVNSSLIVVIRGPRATIWGSVYLDEHGEEDRDLKRGKPLYLSDERYKRLHQQWLTHSFDTVCKRWIFHQDKL